MAQLYATLETCNFLYQLQMSTVKECLTEMTDVEIEAVPDRGKFPNIKIILQLTH